MNKIFIFTMICLIVFSCESNITSNDKDEKYEITNSYIIDIDAQSEFSLENIDGNITLTGESGLDSIVVNITKTVRAATYEDAVLRMEDIEISFLNTESHLGISTEFPQSNEYDYQVDFDIIIPDHLITELTCTNGNLEASGIHSESEIALVNGNILIQDILADMDIETINGNIIVDQMEGHLITSSTNGNVIISSLAGSLLTSLENGIVEVQIDSDIDENSQVVVANGNITLTIPYNTALQMEMSVGSGTIILDDEFEFTEIQSIQNSFSGALNGGGEEMALTVTNGVIQLHGF